MCMHVEDLGGVHLKAAAKEGPELVHLLFEHLLPLRPLAFAASTGTGWSS